MNVISIKRNLRGLKRLELKLRRGTAAHRPSPLVWDSFFDLRSAGRAKYDLAALAVMSREEYKKVIGEYWSFVYRTFFDEADFHAVRFDTGVLLRWGLPPDADETEVKRRFRALAKQHHPDTGGNADAFIALMREYRTLVGK